MRESELDGAARLRGTRVKPVACLALSTTPSMMDPVTCLFDTLFDGILIATPNLS